MIIPYEVDVPFDHRPWMNYVIIALAILAFVAQYRQMQLFNEQRHQEIYRILESEEKNKKLTEETIRNTALQSFRNVENPVKKYMLWDFSASSLFGHIWLHGGILHLVGNMIFLWVFGNAVCSKIGSLLYGPVYVGLGVIAGIGGLIFREIPGLGASGAINAIVGMYLVFFPRNEISCFYWIFWRPGTFSCSSYWMVLYWFVFDILGMAFGGGGVAYGVHVTGFAAGFGLAVAMLMTKWTVMEKDEESLLEVFGIHKKAPAHFSSDGKLLENLASIGQNSDTRINRQISFSESSLPSSASLSSPPQQPSQSLAAEDLLASTAWPSSLDMPDSAFSDEPLTSSGQKTTAAMAARPQLASSGMVPPAKKSEAPRPADGFIRFSCTCGHKFKVPASQTGKSGRCSHCKGVIRIPHSSTVPPRQK
jgi:membrane associated rhomboid family serine protease